MEISLKIKKEFKRLFTKNKSKRNLSELYYLLLTIIENHTKTINEQQKRYGLGICDYINYLHDINYINNEEYNRLYKNFQKNIPSLNLHVNFYNQNSSSKKDVFLTTERRKRFVKYLIKNHHE